MSLSQASEYAWRPQAGPQEAFIKAEFYFDVLLGGARGGGKTDACLGEFALHAQKYGSNARGVFMRREMPQADSLIDRSHQIYGQMGWSFHKMERQWTAPNGAILRFRPLEDDRDAEKYQGQFFSRVYLEELTNWPTPKAPDKMKATLRSAAGVPVGFRATANPGGAGHHWVKARYIDPAPAGRVAIMDEAGKKDRIFIPARVTDNTALITNDPEYVERLKLTGSRELVRAWLEGDWAVVEGAFFDNFSSARHIVRPFEIPKHWVRFRAMDWGSAAPFSVGWYAVASDDYRLLDGRCLPRGGLVKYREWYGASSPNVGLKLTAETVAAGIHDREALERIDYGVLDPAAFAQDGGPSIAERLRYKPYEIAFRPADNKRIGTLGHIAGWDLVRHRLDGEAADRPMLIFFDTCRDTIRTLPLVQHDPVRVEDLDCFVAGTLVSTPFGSKPIEELVPGDIVCTPIGYRPVTASYKSGVANTLSWVRFEDGRVLIGTPQHKIYVSGKGLTRLSDVVCYDTLIERNTHWQSNALHTMALFTHDMRAALTTIQTELSYRAGRLLCTAKCGLMAMGKFLMGVTSTTSMATTTTTTYPISSVCRERIITGTTPENVYRPGQIYMRSSTSGDEAMKERAFSGTIPAKCESGHRRDLLRADIVRCLLALETLSKSIAPISAPILLAASKLKSLARFVVSGSLQGKAKQRKSGRVRITAVGRLGEGMPVFNITVHEAQMFYANGILSSNTKSEDHAVDELRYACASRPWIRNTKRDDAPLKGLESLTLQRLWDRNAAQKDKRL